MSLPQAAARGARRASMAATVRDLDTLMARAVALEVQAQEWRIKYLRAQDDIADLKAQLNTALQAGNELIRLVDTLRAERDTARVTGR